MPKLCDTVRYFDIRRTTSRKVEVRFNPDMVWRVLSRLYSNSPMIMPEKLYLTGTPWDFRYWGNSIFL